MLKRMISLFLCAAMIVTMLPVQTIALETEELTTQILETEPVEEKTEPVEDEVDPLEEEPTEDETEPVEEENESTEELEQIEQEPVLSDDSIIASGACGDNLTWELDDGGILTISGTGEFDFFMFSDEVPWYSYADSVTEVSLPEGLGSIAMYTFAYCRNLKSVTIPESVYSINSNAFLYSGITSLTIPRNVMNIDASCFQGCYDLTEIIVDPENENYCSVDGIMFSKDLSTLHYYPCGISAEMYTVPDNVAVIGEHAFISCTNLKRIELPNGLTQIGFGAFSNLNIKAILIPASISNIGTYAFYSCDELNTVYYTGTEEQWNTLTENNIGDNNDPLLNATVQCNWDGSSIPENPDPTTPTEPTEPEDDTISGTCGDDLAWTLQDNVLTISGTGAMTDYADDSAPWLGNAILEIVLPDGLTRIGDYAFQSSLISNIEIPGTVQEIGQGAFFYCSNLKSVDIPAGISSIADDTFGYCRSMTSISIPESVTNIGAGAFYYCSSLKNIEVPDGITSIANNTFALCKSLTNIKIPEGVTDIGDGAFNQCSSLTEIEIPESVTSIGEMAFMGCESFISVDIPEGVTEIKSSTFSSCKKLETVEIPTSVSAIGTAAFMGCTSLKTVTIPKGVITIDGQAFNKCISLESITIADSVISIGHSVFSGCSSLISLTIPNSVTSIGSNLCNSCDSLVSAVISDKLNEIPYFSFKNCTSLKSISIPDSLTQIGTGAFSGCSSLKNIKLPSGITNINSETFSGCSSLDDVEIPSNVNSISDKAFYNCSGLTNITISPNLYMVFSEAFYGCNNLTDVFFTGNEGQWKSFVTRVNSGNDPILNATVHYDDGEEITGSCGEDLTWTLKGSSLTISGSGAMTDYSSREDVPWHQYRAEITKVTLPEGLTSICYDAFASCTYLTTITLPQSLTSIAGGAFSWSGITGVTIPAATTNIASGAFQSCNSLAAFEVDGANPNYCDIDGVLFSKDGTVLHTYPAGAASANYSVPEGTTTLGNSAFMGCHNLIGLSLPEGLTTIYGSFYCDNLTNMQLPESLNYVGYYAFLTTPVFSTVYYAGTQEQWQTLVADGIMDGNESLLAAPVHCNWTGEPEVITGVHLTADRESAWTGETVNFTVTVYPEAAEVSFYAEDLLFASVALTDNTGILPYAFTMAGDRQISARTDDGRVSQTLILPIQCIGQLNQPVLEAASPQDLTDGLVCSWNTTDNTDAYVLRVRTADGREVLQRNIADDGSERMTCTISAEELGGAGTYELYLMNSGYQYDQNESATVTVEFVELIAEGTCGPTATWTLTDTGTLTISGTGMVTEAPWYDDCHAQIKNVTVADGITSICEYAFADCTNLMKVTMPASVDQISVGAFSNCTGITSAGPIGSGADYEFGWTTSIPSGAFCYMSGLSKITWPDGLTSIGDSAFLLCGFTKVVIPEGVKTIGDKAFADCASLKRLAIPSTADSVGKYAFLNCAQLNDVFIMSKSITIGEKAFDACGTISHVLYAASEVRKSAVNIFAGNQSLKTAECVHYGWKNPETSQVLIKRYGVWYNALEDDQVLALQSSEVVDLCIIAGIETQHNVKLCLEQNGTYILSSSSGIFRDIRNIELITKDKPVYVAIADETGHVAFREQLSIRIKDAFTLTWEYYNFNENQVVRDEEPVSSGEEIYHWELVDVPGYKFLGWYTSRNYEGVEFFSNENKINREQIINDIVLYAYWDTTSLNSQKDIWSFGNDPQIFDGNFENVNDKVKAKYEITDSDFEKLIESLGTDEDGIAKIIDKKKKTWSGSCFGMSSLVVLSKTGNIDISDFPEKDGTYYTDIYNARLIRNKKARDVGTIESLINFYHLRQSASPIEKLQFDYNEFDSSANLKEIVQKMESVDEPVVLGIQLHKTDGTFDWHAVVGYDLEKNGTNYSFQIYDCSKPPQKRYSVKIFNNFGSYSAEYPEWEEDWADEAPNGIKLIAAWTAEDLMVIPILEKPNTLDQTVFSMRTVSTSSYCMQSSYPNFSISNGVQTATIRNGKKVDGDLLITCNGIVGVPSSYHFELPILAADSYYTIIQSGTGKMETTFQYSDSQNGFFLSQEADTAGIINIRADGGIITEYESSAVQTVGVTYNDRTTPWYITTASGRSSGITMIPFEDAVQISAAEETMINITASTAFNETSFNSVSVDSEGLTVEGGENAGCIISQKEEILAYDVFGHSVVFDSQYGSLVDTLANVPTDSLILEPTLPTKTGYIFEGWFKDTEYTEPWDFATDTVTEDLVLYAGWSVDPNYMKSVTFRVSGMDDQIVYMPVNSLIPVEYAPTASDGGAILWYTDRACTEPWNFETDTLTGSVILYGQVDTHVENRLTVDSAELDGQTSVWIDGREFAVKTIGDIAYLDLPNANAKTMVTYTYQNADDADVHTHIPTGMKVWTLSNTDGIYTATRVEELDDMLTYAGCSIRVKGNQGIRMITSIDQTNKDALTAAGLAGYTLEEYGTVIAWASQLGTTKPLSLGKSYVSSNYAYKKDMADPIFNSDGNVMQYTNVLVGFTLDQCKDDIAMRPYMILKDTEGNEITLYGGIVERSIGYIAQQNQDIYAEGTEEYAYIMNIINHVYGEDNIS